MNYRSRDDIISVILNAANGGDADLTKTKIMYKAFLGHHQLQEYLMLLMRMTCFIMIH